MPAGVGACESVGNLDGVSDRLIGRHTTRRNQFVQRLPGHVLHDHKVHAALRTDVVNHADIGMLQSRDGFCFLRETLMQLWVRGEMSGQNFNRYRALQPCIEGAIHFAHAARPEQRLDFVRPEFCARD